MPMAHCLQERCDAFMTDPVINENQLLQLLSEQRWVRDPFGFGAVLPTDPQ